MRSEIIAVLVPKNSRSAALLMRRANGEFSLARIDARLATASRAAAVWTGVRSAFIDGETPAHLLGAEVGMRHAVNPN